MSNMRTLIVHQPTMLGHTVEDVKQTVINRNSGILMGCEFPANTLSLRDLVGNPNFNLSEHVCAMLTEVGMLSRTPALNDNGRQRKLKNGELLWDYSWVDNPNNLLLTLTQNQLHALAWDLRHHRNFVHISVVNEDPTPSENELDSSDSEEYDESNDDEDAFTELDEFTESDFPSDSNV